MSRPILRWLLLLVLGLTPALFLGCSVRGLQDPSVPSLSSDPVNLEGKCANIIYFHRPYECLCASKVELRLREVIRKYFGGETEDGLIAFKSIDIEKPENTEIVGNYGVYTSKLLIITSVGNQRVEDVTLEILPKLNDEESVATAIRARVQEVLIEFSKERRLLAGLIVLSALLYTWLLYETRWLTLRLHSYPL